MLLQSAINKEMVEGNLEQAIELYKRVSATYASNDLINSSPQGKAWPACEKNLSTPDEAWPGAPLKSTN